MTVEHFSHVMHLGSTVTGIIRNDRCGGRHSPGPGRPADAGICIPVIRHFAGKVPIFGVCLGHQAICKAFGGTVSYAKELMHGKKKLIHKTGELQLFKGLDRDIPSGPVPFIGGPGGDFTGGASGDSPLRRRIQCHRNLLPFY